MLSVRSGASCPGPPIPRMMMLVMLFVWFIFWVGSMNPWTMLFRLLSCWSSLK